MKQYFSWIITAAIIVIIFGTMYGVVQQAQRSDANFPQIQLAEDAAAMLKQGRSPAQLINTPVDIDRSLAPFIVVYDNKGKPVTGTGYEEKLLPEIPLGVLQASRGKEYHAVTWQPKGDVRIAAVSVTAGDRYVVSGRSLREVEKNETRTLQIAFLGSLLSLMLLTVASAVKNGWRLPKIS